jgi:hypothetical protein
MRDGKIKDKILTARKKRDHRALDLFRIWTIGNGVVLFLIFPYFA